MSVISRATHARFATLLAAAGAFLSPHVAGAEPSTVTSLGSFETMGGATSDSGWGWCMEADYNAATKNVDLFEAPCEAPTNETVGWNLKTSNQNFEITTSGFIHAIQRTASGGQTDLGCLDVLDDDAVAGTEVLVNPLTNPWGCKAGNQAEIWAFRSGEITLVQNPSLCLMAPSSGPNGASGRITLQTCNDSPNQQFLPINLSVSLKSGLGNGLSFLDNGNGDCVVGTPLVDATWDNGGADEVVLFEPFNESGYHALFTGQQVPFGSLPGYPEGNPNVGGPGYAVQACGQEECESWIYTGLFEYETYGGGVTNNCQAYPLGDAFSGSQARWGYNYQSLRIENAMTVSCAGSSDCWGLPTCIVDSGNGNFPTTSVCPMANAATAAEKWTMTLWGLPNVQ